MDKELIKVTEMCAFNRKYLNTHPHDLRDQEWCNQFNVLKETTPLTWEQEEKERYDTINALMLDIPIDSVCSVYCWDSALGQTREYMSYEDTIAWVGSCAYKNCLQVVAVKPAVIQREIDKLQKEAYRLSKLYKGTA